MKQHQKSDFLLLSIYYIYCTIASIIPSNVSKTIVNHHQILQFLWVVKAVNQNIGAKHHYVIAFTVLHNETQWLHLTSARSAGDKRPVDLSPASRGSRGTMIMDGVYTHIYNILSIDDNNHAVSHI